MLQIKIQGADVKELYVNVMNMALLLDRGGSQMFTQSAPVEVPVDPAPPVEVPVDPAPPAEEITLAEPTVVEVMPNPPVMEPEKKPRKPRAPKPEPVTIDAAPAEEPKADLTIDDMRARVKAIVEAHQERGHEMPECIAYVRKLYAPFGVKLSTDLKPEQFAEFIAASQAYLDGSAE